MPIQKTLSIIKPDAVASGKIDLVVSYIKKAGLQVLVSKRLQLSRLQASSFYGIHADRPFFPRLVDFMVSGPIVVQVLSCDHGDPVSVYRLVMGATNPDDAGVGTIRGDLAESIERNCVHGSDSRENAEQEIRFFFAGYELL